MKFFIDTEFSEGFNKPFMGRNRHYIDFISIGIIAEDGSEYYAVSYDFDIKAAWNKYDEIDANTPANHALNKIRIYWLRHNVLFPIWKELEYKHYRSTSNEIKEEYFEVLDSMPENKRVEFYINEMQEYNYLGPKFTLPRLTELLHAYGKSNKIIAAEIIDFVAPPLKRTDGHMGYYSVEDYLKSNPPEFYGYYADYDWVVICSLFGRMVDLPKGFPMYCRDLKQTYDEQNTRWHNLRVNSQDKVPDLKEFIDYPKLENEHNALDDAKWHFELYKFIRKHYV